MTATLTTILDQLTLGQPITADRLTLVPLLFPHRASLDYLMLDEAVAKDLLGIREVSAGGSVPQLLAVNKADVHVLILDGATLLGCKQNRVVNMTILLEPKSETAIPVSCVERGRWHSVSASAYAGGSSDKVLREMMCEGTSRGLKSYGTPAVSQGEVWNHVSNMLSASSAQSATQAYHEVFEKWKDPIREYESALPCPDDAQGVGVLIDGRVEMIDLFDRGATLRAAWPTLIRGYAATALRSRPNGAHTETVGEFLRKTRSARQEACPSIGAGGSIRLDSEDVLGAALVHDDSLVHLSLFARREKPSAQTMPPSVAATEVPPPANPDAPTVVSDAPTTVQAKRWWRFWRS